MLNHWIVFVLKIPVPFGRETLFECIGKYYTTQDIIFYFEAFLNIINLLIIDLRFI